MPTLGFDLYLNAHSKPHIEIQTYKFKPYALPLQDSMLSM